MIAKIIIIIILAIVLPDLYIDLHYLRHRTNYNLWKRIVWWIPTIIIIVISICFALSKKFAPDDMRILVGYLMLLGIFVLPKIIFSICSFLGWRHCVFHKTHFNWGNVIGLFLSFISVIMVVYGFTIGPRKLNVVNVEIPIKRLPKSFNGLRIVLFSDAHINSFHNIMEDRLIDDIDTISALKPDIICFAGDLQDIQPSELYRYKNILSQIAKKTKVPVYSVLGNHDYSMYQIGTPKIKAENERKIQEYEKAIGWHLLNNEHKAFYSPNRKDSIIIAGEGNCGTGRFPNKSDIKKTMRGVKKNDIVILLQHDPITWESRILPNSNAVLTLSGHTHGGQINIFGLRPTKFIYPNDHGLAEKNGRYLYVTSGIGALIPFRLGVPAEITVITLKTKK